MPEFRLTIELGNAAMETAGDVARALRSTAERVGSGRFSPEGESGRIHDDNGNTVGSWTVVP